MVARRVRARQKGITGYRSAMRPGWLGNPFPVSEYGLEGSLNLFEDYLREKVEDDWLFQDRFSELEGEDIGCTCPLDQKCHVDIIIKVLDDLLNGEVKPHGFSYNG